MELYLERLKDHAKEVNSRNAKAARKEVLENNSLIRLRTRNYFTTRSPTLPRRKALLLLKKFDSALRHKRRSEIP
jgi:hypothetical protein